MIERLDPDMIFGFETEAERARYIENDFRIRQGLCPNGHGLMQQTAVTQTCNSCGFGTNQMPEYGTAQ